MYYSLGVNNPRKSTYHWHTEQVLGESDAQASVTKTNHNGQNMKKEMKRENSLDRDKCDRRYYSLIARELLLEADLTTETC